MKTTKELLGARIKELRKAKRLSQSQLSESIGIDPKHLSRIEVGNSYPSLDRLERMAEVLGVDIKDFFEFGHLEKKKEVLESLYKLLKEANEDNLRLIYKIIKSIVR
ncbi:MAG: helix-turn-helix transcriptional regulator [Nitrospirota bacterium]